MQILDAFTIFATLLLTGNELAISMFVNPAIWRRDDQSLASELAGSLGQFMPFWYAFCLLLLGSEAYLRRHQAGHGLLLSAVALWIANIIYTVTTLVPINDRLASINAKHEVVSDWKQQSKRWDRHHRLRIFILLLSVVVFYLGRGLVWCL
jgi:uncharacterized membrane protein